ncbi:MAG TPA: tRNA-dihydrouridine synthase, partial [Anaerolineales bacterium]|nr:tRNA-dihydrouridine synthase [Anaerolineales bacterium]
MKAHTNVDAVMIGRGAIPNPWIFSRLDRDQVPPEMLKQTIRKHLARCVEFYGDGDGSRLFRKNAVQYVMMQHLTRDERKEILKTRPSAEFLELLEKIYDSPIIPQPAIP